MKMETKPEQDRQALAATEAQQAKARVLERVKQILDASPYSSVAQLRLVVARAMLAGVRVAGASSAPPEPRPIKIDLLLVVLETCKGYFEMTKRMGLPQDRFRFTPQTLREMIMAEKGECFGLNTHELAKAIRESLQLKTVRNGTFYYLAFDPELEKVWEMRGRGLYYEVSRAGIDKCMQLLDM
jgi:hypothetical protein